MALDGPRAVPAGDLRTDFVADRVAEDGRVTRARCHHPADAPFDRTATPAVLEKRHMVLPWKANHHVQPTLLGSVEQPSRRHRVCAYGVDPVRRHLCEVARDHLTLRVVETLGVATECPVGHAAHIQLAIADEQELATDDRALAHRCGQRVRR